MPDFARNVTRTPLNSSAIEGFLEGKVPADNRNFFYVTEDLVSFDSADISSLLQEASCSELYVVYGVHFDNVLFLTELLDYTIVFIECDFHGIVIKTDTSVGFIACSGKNLGFDSINGLSTIVVNSCVWRNAKFSGGSEAFLRINDSQIKNVTLTNGSYNFFESHGSEFNKLEVTDCSSFDELVLSSAKVSHLNIKACKQINTLVLEGRTGIESFILQQSFLTSISLEEDTHVKLFQFHEVVIKNASLKGRAIVDQLAFESKTEVEELDIIGNAIIDKLFIVKSKVRTLSFDRGTICYQLTIQNGVCDYLNSVRDSRLLSLEIFDSEIGQVFLAYQQSDLLIGHSSIIRFSIKQCRLNDCGLELTKKAEMFFDNSTINYLNLEGCALPRDGVLSFLDCRFHVIRFSRTIIIGQLALQNVRATPFIEISPIPARSAGDESGLPGAEVVVDSGKVRDSMIVFLNEKIDFFNMFLRKRLSALNYPGPAMELINSSLGKTELTDCRLSEFNILFRNSKILEVFTPGTKFDFRKIGIAGAVDLHDETEQKASLHHQLKKVYENQGDFVQSSYHHSQAMSYHYRLLRFQYNGADFVKRVSTWFERRGFTLNWLSNAYGESWPRALLFTLSVTFFWYTCYYMSVHFNEPISFSRAAVAGYFKRVIPFFDITHKINVDTTPGWAVLWDCLGRIFIGYGIFQFIAAFRRHGKKAV